MSGNQEEAKILSGIKAGMKKTWVGSSWVQILLPVKFTLKELMLNISFFSALYTQMKILHVLDI